MTVPVGGHYELYPDSQNNLLKGGCLVVYLNDATVAPFVGECEIKSIIIDGKEVPGYYFTYNNEEHLYFNTLQYSPVTRDPGHYYLAEDVMDECTVELPKGVKIYWGQRVQVR